MRFTKVFLGADHWTSEWGGGMGDFRIKMISCRLQVISTKKIIGLKKQQQQQEWRIMLEKTKQNKTTTTTEKSSYKKFYLQRFEEEERSQLKFAKIVVLITFYPFTRSGTRNEPPEIGAGPTLIHAFTRAFSHGPLPRRLWF